MLESSLLILSRGEYMKMEKAVMTWFFNVKLIDNLKMALITVTVC